jgi:hypothetical protein
MSTNGLQKANRSLPLPERASGSSTRRHSVTAAQQNSAVMLQYSTPSSALKPQRLPESEVRYE